MTKTKKTTTTTTKKKPSKKAERWYPPHGATISYEICREILERATFFKEELGYELVLFRDPNNPNQPCENDYAMIGTITEPYPAAVYDKTRLIGCVKATWNLTDEKARAVVDSYQFVGFHKLQKGAPIIVTSLFKPELLN